MSYTPKVEEVMAHVAGLDFELEDFLELAVAAADQAGMSPMMQRQLRLELEKCIDRGEARVWFYVPDYPAVRAMLTEAYRRFGVTEHAAEPGRVGGRPDAADVHVRGLQWRIAEFAIWLATKASIAGLMVEGKLVDPSGGHP